MFGLMADVESDNSVIQQHCCRQTFQLIKGEVEFHGASRGLQHCGFSLLTELRCQTAAFPTKHHYCCSQFVNKQTWCFRREVPSCPHVKSFLFCAITNHCTFFGFRCLLGYTAKRLWHLPSTAVDDSPTIPQIEEVHSHTMQIYSRVQASLCVLSGEVFVSKVSYPPPAADFTLLPLPSSLWSVICLPPTLSPVLSFLLGGRVMCYYVCVCVGVCVPLLDPPPL